MENGLDPYRYLTWLLKSAGSLELVELKRIRKLLPWNAPDACKVN